MRRIISFLSAAITAFSLAASSQVDMQHEEELPISEGSVSDNILIAYFSWAENAVLPEGDGEADAVSSPSVRVPGNVQQPAGWIQEETGGDLFSIRVTEPYPSDWDACLERANEERGSNARPELQENIRDPERYDTVFLGYPNWWYGVPMPLLSFLDQNDFSGKNVYLFCSHGTGGLANSVDLITEAVPDAIISDNIFDCCEEDAPSSEDDVKSWVNELGFFIASANQNEQEEVSMRISVTDGENKIEYELNNSGAARTLYEMLPLTVGVEDFSTNEKTFYPPKELPCEDTPLAGTDAEGGTLAYYEPWGDVVMFYAGYNGNSSLYELGHAVSGTDSISSLSGTITIEAVE